MVNPDEHRQKFVEIIRVLRRIAKDRKLEERLTSSAGNGNANRGATVASNLGSNSIPTPQALVYGGMTVTAFNAFDEFCGNVTRSYVDRMLGSKAKDEVPESLVLELTYGAMRSFINNVKYLTGANGAKPNSSEMIDFTLDLARPIGHMETGKVSGTGFSFSPSGFDISFGDLKSSIDSFGLPSAREAFLNEKERVLPEDDFKDFKKRINGSYMQRIMDAVMGPGFDLGSRFKNVKDHRNSAAHSLATAISSSDLLSDLHALTDCAYSYEVAIITLINRILDKDNRPFFWNNHFIDFPPIAVFEWSQEASRWKYGITGTHRRARISDVDIGQCASRVFSNRHPFQWGSYDAKCRPMGAVFVKEGFVADWRVNYSWAG